MIKVTDLSKVFRTEEIETTALNGVSFEIKDGEFVAIMECIITYLGYTVDRIDIDLLLPGSVLRVLLRCHILYTDIGKPRGCNLCRLRAYPMPLGIRADVDIHLIKMCF